MTSEQTGLYFGQAQIENARARRDDTTTETPDALRRSWQWLKASPGSIIEEEKLDGGDTRVIRKPKLKGLAAAQVDAFCYHFLDDEDAAHRVATYLQRSGAFKQRETLLDTLMHTLTGAQVFQMVRQHPAMQPAQDAWLHDYSDFLQTVNADVDARPLEELWLMTATIVSGIIRHDDAQFEDGITQFKHLIDTQIHPEGYLRSLTDENSDRTFEQHTLGVGALTLAAEAATQTGVDLWTYENRGVGVNTAAAYLVYYYFYPDKWRWGQDDLTEEMTAALFAQQGAWIEMVTYRGYPRGVEMLLEQQRPFYSASMGGLTTLTHYKSQPQKKKRGWFS